MPRRPPRRSELFAALLRQEVGFFDASETGTLTSRLTSDATKVRPWARPSSSSNSRPRRRGVTGRRAR